MLDPCSSKQSYNTLYYEVLSIQFINHNFCRLVVLQIQLINIAFKKCTYCMCVMSGNTATLIVSSVSYICTKLECEVKPAFDLWAL